MSQITETVTPRISNGTWTFGSATRNKSDKLADTEMKVMHIAIFKFKILSAVIFQSLQMRMYGSDDEAGPFCTP